MTIIYFTDKDGKVTKHSTIDTSDCPIEEAVEWVNRFNLEREFPDTAHAKWFPDDSITAYLYKLVLDQAQEVSQLGELLDNALHATYDLAQLREGE